MHGAEHLDSPHAPAPLSGSLQREADTKNQPHLASPVQLQQTNKRKKHTTNIEPGKRESSKPTPRRTRRRQAGRQSSQFAVEAALVGGGDRAAGERLGRDGDGRGDVERGGEDGLLPADAAVVRAGGGPRGGGHHSRRPAAQGERRGAAPPHPQGEHRRRALRATPGRRIHRPLLARQRRRPRPALRPLRAAQGQSQGQSDGV